MDGWSPRTGKPLPAGADPARTLTVYSRGRDIAEPLFARFEKQTGITVKARWGDPIEPAKQIIDDGAGTSADVYFGPLSDALGALSVAGRLGPPPRHQVPHRSDDRRVALGEPAPRGSRPPLRAVPGCCRSTPFDETKGRRAAADTLANTFGADGGV